MANAGMHALIGTTVKKLAPKKAWLFLGIVLGNMLPDLDNYAVAVVTLTGGDPHPMHRTFTHSIFTILTLIVIFFIFAKLRGDDRWSNLGLGLGIGVGMHMAVDMLVWFNGVNLLWPLGGEYTLWKTPLAEDHWFMKFIAHPAEFLFFWLYLAWLGKTATANNTDGGHLKGLRGWTIAMLILFAVTLPLAYMEIKLFATVAGALYIVSLTAVFLFTIKFRETLEAG